MTPEGKEGRDVVRMMDADVVLLGRVGPKESGRRLSSCLLTVEFLDAAREGGAMSAM